MEEELVILSHPLGYVVDNFPFIDQPEDNLDNRLVGKMLVDILASLKEKRQIIVATHNPNSCLR